jgi:hypothetical protein
MLSDVQRSTAEAITTSLEASFERFMPEEGSESVLDPNVALAPLTARLDALPSAIGAELTKALQAAQADALKQMTELEGVIPPEVTGAIGGNLAASHRKAGDLKNAIGQGLLGPYGALLQQFMPPLYEYLAENPDMVVQALEMPVVQKLIQRFASQAGGIVKGAEEAVGGWGR